MSRHRRPVRIALAVTAAVLVGSLAGVALAAGRSAARRSGGALRGAGSTFVAPLVDAWVKPVGSALGIALSYSPVGSGGGVAAISNREVDFGASDAPLSQFSPTCTTCVQIPWALSGTAVLYNLPGAPNLLKLSGPVLAGIYLGRITRWNDPAIRRLNRGVKLPAMRITVVHRSDSSGTSFNFTDYLSRVSRVWKAKIGRGTSVAWPAGIGGKGSSGVSGLVHETPGAIGYADVAYATRAHLAVARIENRAGRFVIPRLQNIKAASVLDTHPARDGSLSIVDPPKSAKYANAYPISTYTYVDVQQRSANAAALRRLLTWAVTKGQRYGPPLVFVPLPAAVVAFDRRQIARIR
ncbi:MAG TPA: phosphate ABC transporter substrate-binding protein PstS [Gaiellaceae bacterium]|nr:phosphate ABC transporter substrate-binding protein PstS [Gaiellaceae bacterium]